MSAIKIVFLFFILMIPSLSFADAPISNNSPDGNQGEPRGVNWKASVDKIEKSILYLKLRKIYGSCRFGEFPLAKEGDMVTVHINENKANEYKVGQIINVWVISAPALPDGDGGVVNTASLDIPNCNKAAP